MWGRWFTCTGSGAWPGKLSFLTGRGGTVAVVSLPADAVRTMRAEEVLHARPLAA